MSRRIYVTLPNFKGAPAIVKLEHNSNLQITSLQRPQKLSTYHPIISHIYVFRTGHINERRAVRTQDVAIKVTLQEVLATLPSTPHVSTTRSNPAKGLLKCFSDTKAHRILEFQRVFCRDNARCDYQTFHSKGYFRLLRVITHRYLT